MRSRRLSAVAFTAALFGLGAIPSSALAGFGPPPGPTSPPFWQCPAVGKSTSCSFLVDVTGSGSSQSATVYADPSQEYYDNGNDDEIVAVQNDSSSPLSSIHLGVPNSGDSLFSFDGDGLCNPGVGATPAGCPFGGASNTSDPYDYYGPDMNFQPGYGPDDGTVNFTPALQPGQYTFFGLDAPFGQVVIPVGNATDYVTTTLTSADGTITGANVSAPAPTDFSDQAQLQGANSSSASGSVTYKVYSDPNCTKLVADATPTPNTFTGGSFSIPASTRVGSALPTNAVYYWQATFTPDSSDTVDTASVGACGSETMSFGTPPSKPANGLQTTLSGAGRSGASLTVPPGTPVTDAATLTGAGANTATGTVTYAVFSDPACTTQVNAYSPKGDVRSVNGGTAPASAAVTLPLGTYYFRATYSGDANHASAVSPCGAEVLTVAPVASVVAKATVVKTVINNVVSTNYAGRLTIVAGVVNAGALGKRSRKCGSGAVLVHRRCVSTSFGSTSATETAAGTFLLQVKPSKIARRALAAGKTLHVTETVTLVPSTAGIGAATTTVHVTIKGAKHKKKHRRRK